MPTTNLSRWSKNSWRNEIQPINHQSIANHSSIWPCVSPCKDPYIPFSQELFDASHFLLSLAPQNVFINLGLIILGTCLGFLTITVLPAQGQGTQDELNLNHLLVISAKAGIHLTQTSTFIVDQSYLGQTPRVALGLRNRIG